MPLVLLRLLLWWLLLDRHRDAVAAAVDARWRAVALTSTGRINTLKEEGSDYAEPSQEGPGRVRPPETALSLTSFRSIRGSLPKAQDPGFWARPDPARASLWAATWVKVCRWR